MGDWKIKGSDLYHLCQYNRERSKGYPIIVAGGLVLQDPRGYYCEACGEAPPTEMLDVAMLAGIRFVPVDRSSFITWMSKKDGQKN